MQCWVAIVSTQHCVTVKKSSIQQQILAGASQLASRATKEGAGEHLSRWQRQTILEEGGRCGVGWGAFWELDLSYLYFTSGRQG